MNGGHPLFPFCNNDRITKLLFAVPRVPFTYMRMVCGILRGGIPVPSAPSLYGKFTAEGVNGPATSEQRHYTP